MMFPGLELRRLLLIERARAGLSEDWYPDRWTDAGEIIWSNGEERLTK